MPRQYQMPLLQHGGGNCSICGSPGTNKSTCPWNPDAGVPNHAKHPLAVGAAKHPLAVGAAKAKPGLLVPGAPIIRPGKLAAAAVPHGVVNPEGRLSAGAYYRKHGGDACVGDICDIRGDGQLKCLLVRSNGTPYWAAYSTKSDKQAACGKVPWTPNCKYVE